MSKKKAYSAACVKIALSYFPLPIPLRGKMPCCSIHSNDSSNVCFEYGSNTSRSTRAPAPRIHLVMEAHREFLLVVVRVKLGPQVDVALRAA
jgi:hypothetical protein